MIIVMKSKADQQELDNVIKWIESVGYKAHVSKGVERTIIGAVGDERGKVALKAAENMPGVEKVMPILQPYKLASRETKEGNTVIKVGDVEEIRVDCDADVLLLKVTPAGPACHSGENTCFYRKLEEPNDPC